EVRLAEAIAREPQTDEITIDCAYDGAEGLLKARENNYNVIVADMRLLEKKGHELCHLLREAQVRTPILLLAASQDEADEARTLGIGADDFLAKPFSLPILVTRLRTLIDKGNDSQPTVIQVGDLELDPLKRVCRRAENTIELTARECALLEFFMQRPGEVLSKQQIFDSVWGVDSEGYLNIVEVYVGYLRRKVDEPFGRQSIQTVRGVGYRLLEETP
ncbi:MAG TPA: response regulator transcription factor, partial [Candidatus Binatia bacterium]|nr:response regulator transcription factor [Candidatus Binatia bacterium]